MRGIVFRLSIAILTFSVGLAANHLVFDSLRQSVTRVAREESHTVSPVSKSSRKYEALLTGERPARDGYPVAFTGFSTSDGRRFTRDSIYFDSAARANHELQVALTRAREIISIEPFPAADGKQLGKLAIATFATKSDYAPAAMLWTDGTTFRYVRSSSLESIHEFEKDFQLKRCVPYCTD